MTSLAPASNSSISPQKRSRNDVQKRTLKFQFTLKEGLFDDQGNDTLTIDNIKAEVEIGAYGGIAGTNMEARIFGLSLNNMAALSYKGIQYNGSKQNLMKVWADEKPIFVGSITSCFADLNQMPDAPLIISAFSTGFDQSITAPHSAGKVWRAWQRLSSQLRQG